MESAGLSSPCSRPPRMVHAVKSIQGCGSASPLTDPGPSFLCNADPDPTFHFNADPDTAPHQSDANLRPVSYQTLQGFILSLHASILSVHGPLCLHFEPLKEDPEF